MEIKIQDWRRISKNTISVQVINSTELNELDKLNNGILYIDIRDTNNPTLDQKHIAQTMIGTDPYHRFFIIEMNKKVDIPQVPIGNIIINAIPQNYDEVEKINEVDVIQNTNENMGDTSIKKDNRDYYKYIILGILSILLIIILIKKILA